MERRNVNRGFKKLRVWNDAIELYVNTCRVLADFPFEYKKIAANCMDSAHSISRNIAEGYSRKSIKDYLRFLHIALGSCGEYHSSIYAFHQANQIKHEEFDLLDELHYKTENQLIQLVKSLQIKLKEGNWDETF